MYQLFNMLESLSDKEYYNGKLPPVWNRKCHGCNACVVYCPSKAIQFKTPEAYVALGTLISKKIGLPEKRKRYHNPYIKARDLID